MIEYRRGAGGVVCFVAALAAVPVPGPGEVRAEVPSPQPQLAHVELYTPPTAADSARAAGADHRKRHQVGTGMACFGAACATLGAVNKMGSENHAYDYGEDPSYNGANFALMVGGGIMCLIGLGLALTSPPAAPVTVRVTGGDVHVAARVKF